MKFPRLDRNAWNKLVQQPAGVSGQFRGQAGAVTLPARFILATRPSSTGSPGTVFSCRSSMLRTYPMLQRGPGTNALLDFSRKRHPRGSSEDFPGCGFCGAARRYPQFADGGD